MIWGYHYFWKHPHGYFFLLILLFQQTIRWKKVRGLFPLASFRLSWLLLKTKWETANPSQPGGSDVFFSSVGSCCFHANQPGISNVWCQDSGHGASGILVKKRLQQHGNCTFSQRSGDCDMVPEHHFLKTGTKNGGPLVTLEVIFLNHLI